MPVAGGAEEAHPRGTGEGPVGQAAALAQRAEGLRASGTPATRGVVGLGHVVLGREALAEAVVVRSG